MECYIVRDLLPQYTDELVEEETKKDIEKHLESCAECRKIYQELLMPMNRMNHDVKPEEIDFLKKIKRKTKKTTIFAVVLTAVIICGGIFSWALIKGTPASSTDVSITATVNEQYFSLTFVLDNGKALRLINEIGPSHIINVNETPKIRGLIEMEKYSYSFLMDKDKNPEAYQSIIIRFKDKEIIYSRAEDGQYILLPE